MLILDYNFKVLAIYLRDVVVCSFSFTDKCSFWIVFRKVCFFCNDRCLQQVRLNAT